MRQLYIFTVILLFFFACKIGDEGDPKDTYFLGAIYNLTGSQSSLDIPSARGAQLAVEEINALGGVNGKKVDLILKDGKSDTTTLKTVTTEVFLEHPSVRGFVGLSDTDMLLAAAKIAADNFHVFLSSGATSPKLPAQIPYFLFLACFGDNVQAAAAAEWAYDALQAHTVSVVYDSTDSYTQLLHGYFIERYQELGGQVVTEVPYTHGDVASAIPAIQSADFIFYAALPDDVADGIHLMRQAGFSGPIVGGDAYDEPEVWQINGDITNVYFTTHAYLGSDNPNLRVQSFRQSYVDAYHEEPNAFAALGYDAAGLLMEALRTASTNTAEAVRVAMTEIQGYPGVTGTISYDQDQRIPRKSVTIMRVNFGATNLIDEIIPAKVPEP